MKHRLTLRQYHWNKHKFEGKPKWKHEAIYELTIFDTRVHTEHKEEAHEWIILLAETCPTQGPERFKTLGKTLTELSRTEWNDYINGVCCSYWKISDTFVYEYFLTVMPE